jgi:putative membrane-bound dehydrogenase-like protein
VQATSLFPPSVFAHALCVTMLVASAFTSVATANNPFIHCYPGNRSYVAGEEVTFHLSTNVGKVDVEIARIGAERKLVWSKKGIAAGEHPVPKHASSHGCDWPTAFSVKIPKSWPSGYYEAWTRSGNTQGNRTFFVVRSSQPGRDARILLQLSTNTYNAYSNWGGFSLYTYWGPAHWNKKHELGDVLGRRVTFQRPLYRDDFRRWELPFVQWAERNGYKIDYAINSDLEFHPEMLKHYKLVLSVGHDEYWSAPMRDNLEAYIAKGGNVAFFSGNTCCWQVRSEDSGNDLVCWKEAFKQDPLYKPEGHPLLSTLWSHHLVKRPENQLTGVGFLRGGFHQFRQILDGTGAYKVHRPDHWVFEGSGLKVGEEFGGANTIVGYECDGCEFTMVDGRPVPTGKDGTPENFIILGTAPARWGEDDLGWYKPAHDLWKNNKHEHGCMGIYTKPGGGTVFTAATTDWVHGLSPPLSALGGGVLPTQVQEAPANAAGPLGPGHAAGVYKGGVWNILNSHFSGKVVDEDGKQLPHEITVEFGAAGAEAPITNWGKVPQMSWVNAKSSKGVGNSALMNDMLFSQGVVREQGGVRVRGLPAGEYEVFAPLRHLAVEQSARYRWAIGVNLDRVNGNSFVATGGSQTEWLEATAEQAGNFARAKVRIDGPEDAITMIYDNLDKPYTDIMGFQIARLAGPDDSFRIQFDAGGEHVNHVNRITRNVLNRLSGENPSPPKKNTDNAEYVPQKEATFFNNSAQQVAELRKVPHNQPAVVTAEDDGSLRLLASKAKLFGDEESKIAIYDKQMCVGWWTKQSDYVIWEVDAPRTGAFDASLHYSIPNNWAGNWVEITAGPSRLVLPVPTTGSFDNFVMRKIGSLHLTKGRNRVVMRPLTPVNGEIADVKELRLTAVDPSKPGIPAGGMSPTETTADLQVPAGYEVSLFAAEPLLANPSSICVDSRGRVWVTEIQLYRHNYTWNAPQEDGGKDQARPDRIKVLEDTDGDGVADKATVFYEGLISPMSLAVAGDKVYVAEAPYLYVFEDKDGNLRADGPPRKLLVGFGGFNDDQSLHGLALGPDHKLYMTMGDLSFDVTGPDGVRIAHDTGAVIRCEMDGSQLEVTAWDLKNPLEVAVDSFGHAWFSGNDDDGRQMCRLDWTLDGGNYGWRFWGVYGKRRDAGLPIADAHWHVDQPGVVPPVKITGFGSPVGKMFVESNTLGDHLRGSLVHADPGPREVRVFHVKPEGAGFAARRELLLSSATDTYFRPVDVAMGVDGAMYVADWYDQGVGGHAYNDPNRGRIYVVRKISATKKPAMLGPYKTNADAVVALKSDNVDAQFQARQRILESGEAALPALAEMANHEDYRIAARALWLADRIGGDGRKLVLDALRDDDPAMRALAVRILRGHDAEYEKQILALADDPSLQVGREVMLAIRDIESDEADRTLIKLARQWDGNDRWYLETIGIAARGKAGQANQRFDRYAGYETEKLGDRVRMKRLFAALVDNPDEGFDHRTIALTRLLLPHGQSNEYLVSRLKRENLDAATRGAIIAALGPNVDVAVGRSLIAMIGREDVPIGVQRMALAAVRRNLAGSWAQLRKSDELHRAIKVAIRHTDLRSTALNVVSEARLTSTAMSVRSLISDKDLNASARAAAIDTLAALADIASAPAILSLVKSDDDNETIRTAGIRALAVLRHQPTLKQALTDDSIEMGERLVLIDAVARDSAGAALLYTLIDAGALDAKLRARGIALGAAHADPSVRAVYLQNVPESERPKMLGASVDRKKILALAGDPKRGEQVSRAAACINCHSVNGRGADIGPGLSVIGRKLGREALLDSILDPSRAISPDYAGSIVLTTDGRTFLGFVKATADGVTVRTTDGRFFDMKTDDIDEVAPMKLSLMPEQLATSMTAQGLADLLAYLGELKSETAVVPRWWVAGVFDNDDKGVGFNTAYGPERNPGDVDHAAKFAGIGGREVRWIAVQCEPMSGSRGFDLQAFVTRQKLRQGNLITYHAVAVNSPADQQGTLLIGSEDAVKVWVNGEQVHSNFVRRSAQPGQDEVVIQLRRGDNTLMVKLEQVSAGGALIAALRTEQPVSFERP